MEGKNRLKRKANQEKGRMREEADEDEEDKEGNG